MPVSLEKIVLGVPAYGHSFTVSPSDAVDSSGNLVQITSLHQERSHQHVMVAETKNPCRTSMDFSTLISEGFLNTMEPPPTENHLGSTTAVKP
jgi:hypothetical protein